jgi:hypothetical protein
VNLSQRLASILHVLTSKLNLVGGLRIEIPIRMMLSDQRQQPPARMPNVQPSKFHHKRELLEVLYGTVRAILTRNSVMNHHVQRELKNECMG